VSSIGILPMDLTRRLPEGSAERKTARVSRRWQAKSRNDRRLVQGAPRSVRAPDRPLPYRNRRSLGHARPVYNQGAIWLHVNPRKTKEKCLDFLWPNRDFSTGYSEKTKKLPLGKLAS
jgi:hypothetical protein